MHVLFLQKNKVYKEEKISPDEIKKIIPGKKVMPENIFGNRSFKP
jgi:hypothetical protein